MPASCWSTPKRTSPPSWFTLIGVKTDWVVSFPTKGYHVDSDCDNIQANKNQWRNDGVAALRTFAAEAGLRARAVLSGFPNETQQELMLLYDPDVIAAYSNFARDLILKRELDPKQCCIACSRCTEIMRGAGRCGCVIFDREIYGPIYRAALAKQG